MSNTITIHRNGLELDDIGLRLLDAAVGRAVRGISEDGSCAEIFCADRQPHGWLEFVLRISYAGGGGITVGCIQRAVGREFEFHS